jgi:hypothetical protein
MNGLFEEIRGLKKIFDGKFIMTKEVKRETIDKPLTIKRFELEALKIKQLLDENIIVLPKDIGISDAQVTERTEQFLNMANSTFSIRDEKVHLIDYGEASCLALSQILNEEKIKNVIAVDERTTRMLCERGENLRDLFQKKLHTRINTKKENFRFFKGFGFIRSTELIYVAYKKGIVKLENGVVLDALLYALKFKGCAISDYEISEIKKMR